MTASPTPSPSPSSSPSASLATLFVPAADRAAWREVSPGVHFCTLRAHGQGNGHERGETLLIRMEKGAHAPMHHHPGGEETYLLSGCLRIGEDLLTPGDYLWTPPGEHHDGIAEEETLFFAIVPHGVRLTRR